MRGRRPGIWACRLVLCGATPSGGRFRIIGLRVVVGCFCASTSKHLPLIGIVARLSVVLWLMLGCRRGVNRLREIWIGRLFDSELRRLSMVIW